MDMDDKSIIMKPDWFDYLIVPDVDDAEFQGFGEGDGWEMRDDTPEEMRKAYKAYLKEEKERREEANRKGILIDKI